MDATGSFVDVNDASDAEWSGYWRKNPIKAMTTVSRGQDLWLRVDPNDHLALTLQVATGLSTPLHEMALELVHYRLHRYLAHQASKRVEERDPRF